MEFIAFLLGLRGTPDLVDSMKSSKTLAVMVIIGIILFGCFFGFLVYMAGKQ